MNLNIVNIAFLNDCIKLTKDKALQPPIYSLRAFNGESWVVVANSDDVGHVASLLVRFGYGSGHLSAIKKLQSL